MIYDLSTSPAGAFKQVMGAIADVDDPIAKLLMPEYGAIFVAQNGVTPPDRVIFRNENEVSAFQRSVAVGQVRFGEIDIELQAAAATALKNAIREASLAGLSITPRGADSGRRSYGDTVELWRSRVEPALEHWAERNALSKIEVERIRSLTPFEQVPVVFELEGRGLFFAKDLSKSIIYSVAPPGTSQHLSMLAFDITEFDDEQICSILAAHYWYQTVVSDLPHFTYLGMEERELRSAGLRNTRHLDRLFWIPDI